MPNGSSGMAGLLGMGGGRQDNGAIENLAAQEVDHDDGQEQVERGKSQKGDDQSGHGGDSVGGAEDIVDNPGLPPHLGDGPASLNRDHPQRSAQYHQPQKL